MVMLGCVRLNWLVLIVVFTTTVNEFAFSTALIGSQNTNLLIRQQLSGF